MVKNAYFSSRMGNDQNDQDQVDVQTQRNGFTETELENKQVNDYTNAYHVSSNGDIHAVYEKFDPVSEHTEVYVKGILNSSIEAIGNYRDIPDISESPNANDIKDGSVRSLYEEGDTELRVDKSHRVNEKSENGTKHKSIILVSSSKQDSIKMDKQKSDRNLAKEKDDGGLVNRAFESTDSIAVSKSDKKNITESEEQNTPKIQSESDKHESETSNDTIVTNPNVESDILKSNGFGLKGDEDVLQINGFTHKSTNDDVCLDPVENEAIDIAFKPTKGKKEKNDDDDDVPDVSLFQMFRFADGRDKLLLVIGILSSIISGLALPVNLLVYGRVATGFIYYTILQNSLAAGENSTVYMPFDNPDEYADVYGYVRQHALYFCLIGVAVIVFTFVQLLCFDISQERQMRTIRKRFFKAVIHNDIAWFDLHHGAELGSSFNESMHALSNAMGKDASTCIQWSATFVGCYIMSLVKGWKLALACIAFSPALILVGGFTIRWIRNISATEAKAYAKAGAVVEQALSSVKTVMAFNGQQKESSRYDKNLKAGGGSAFFRGCAMGLAMGGTWLILYCIFAVAFGYGIKLMGDREPGFEPGNVLTIFIGVMIGSVSISQAFPFLETLATGKAAAAKIYHIIDQKPKIDSSSEKGEKLSTIRGRLDLNNVSFSYPSRPDVQVLKNLNISVEPGQTVALVGHSGCGKSTVVQLVERFYDTDNGEVLLDGKNVKDLNVAWFREQIGLVSQEPVLFATTIKENIQHGKEEITDEQIIAAAKEANIHDFISMLPDGYDTLAGDRGTQLSGGQKQRIAIARALVRNPKILLLDEATSALDNESEAIVQKALEKAQEGRTTIIIAHRLSTIRNADKIIAIEEGRVVEQGTHSELMKKKGLYHQLVEHQIHHDTEDDVIEELEHKIIYSGEISEDPHMNEKTFKVESETTTISPKSEEDEDKEKEELLSQFSMKRIMRLNSPEWIYIAVGCLFSIIVGALQPALAFLMSEFLDVFTQSKEEQERAIWVLVGIVLGVGVFNTITRILLSVCFAKAGYKLVLRMRSLTFKSLLKQDMTFYDNEKNSVGILTSRLANDATLVQGATGSKIGNVLESIAVILAALLVAFLTSWKLAFVVVGFLPLMIGMGIAQGKLTMGMFKKNKGTVGQVGQICTETIENIRLVTSLTQEEAFKKKYNKLVDDICSKTVRRTFPTSFLMGVASSIICFAYAGSLTYGAFLVMYDGLEFSLVFRTFAAILFGGMHIGRTSLMGADFTKAKLAAARLFSLIDTEPKIDVSKEEGKILDSFDGSIEFQSVSFQYPSRPDATVLNDISFSASPGETVALVGSSGCGKSTTVSLIQRFYDPITGAVLAGNEDIKSLNLKWLRSRIGLVSQEPVLFDCSIAENIAYGDNENNVPMDRIIAAARSANIHEFISSLPQGYDTNVGSKGTQLSGGQKQRVAIARALVSNPKMLILDEATSALDSKSEKVVQEALDRAREGRTCLVIAHRLSTIQNANKIAIIHKGVVVELGNHSQLLANKGIYYKLIQQHKH